MNFKILFQKWSGFVWAVICFCLYLFVFVCFCLFICIFHFFSSWQVIDVKFNEVKQLVDILGSDEPGDHIQRQFTNPDVPETKYMYRSYLHKIILNFLMVYVFFIHAAFLAVQITGELVNPLLFHVLLQKYFWCTQQRNAYSNSTIEPLEIGLKQVQS